MEIFKKKLTENEIKNLADEMAEVQSGFVESIINIADKYGVNRDYLMEDSIKALTGLTTIGTFEFYKVKGEENE